MRCTLLKEVEERLHVFEIGSRAQRVLLKRHPNLSLPRQVVNCPPHLREHAKDLARLVNEACAESVFCALGVQKSVLPIEQAGVLERTCRAKRVARTLQDPCTRSV